MISVTGQVWLDPTRRGEFEQLTSTVPYAVVFKVVEMFILNHRNIGDLIHVDG